MTRMPERDTGPFENSDHGVVDHADGSFSISRSNRSAPIDWLAAQARAIFGDYAMFHLRGIGDVQVYVERYAKGERGELIAFFHHPKTKILQFDGLVLDDDGEFKATGQI